MLRIPLEAKIDLNANLNTSLLILNDALDAIKRDPDFGRKVAMNVQGHQQSSSYIHSGNFVNAARVIETHHNEYTSVVAVGGNCATILGNIYGNRHSEESFQLQILSELAGRLGYTLVADAKRSKKKKRA